MLKPSDIEEILRLVDASDFQHVRLQLGDMKLEWQRKGGAHVDPVEKAAPRVKAADAQPPSPPADDGAVTIPAPMLGVFWHAPRPGDPPFVKVGDKIMRDTIIGIIEVMKLMNTVPAGAEGIVTAIVAPNGKGVEFGQTLIHVRPA